MSDFFSLVTHLESTKQMCVQVIVIRNMVTVGNADTSRGCHLVTPLWCLDQTVPGCWMEFCYLQKYAPVKVTYGSLHPQLAKLLLLTIDAAGHLSLATEQTATVQQVRPQGHQIQAGNKMTQFMIPSILEQQLKLCSWYSDCTMNWMVQGWNPKQLDCFHVILSLHFQTSLWEISDRGGTCASCAFLGKQQDTAWRKQA